MSLTESFDSLQKCINGMFRDVRDILADDCEPTPLEIQMAQQLKEQARQLEDMKQMMKPLLEAAEKAKREAEEKSKKDIEDWLADIAKKEAEEKAAEEKEAEEKAAEKAKKEAEEREVLRKAEHLRKNREFKQSLTLDSFEKLSANGFQRTRGVYGAVKGFEESMDVIKEIGGEKHMWMRNGCHLSHYQGKLVPYTGNITYNPCNPDLIPMYSLIYGEEPTLYK